MPRGGGSPNYPDWMEDATPETMDRINEIANQLIEDGYSEEQAYQIALERGEEWAQGEGETLETLEELEGLEDLETFEEFEPEA